MRKVGYFLDTNVLMHFVNDRDRSRKIEKRIERIGIEKIYVSSITVYEIHTKLLKAKVSQAKIAALSELFAMFKVVNFNTSAAVAAAKVRVQLEHAGKPIDDPDQLLAGHAKAEKAIVVTNNTHHFKRVHGLKIEDWTA